MKICSDSGGTTCVLSSTSSTITVGCPQAEADSITIATPVYEDNNSITMPISETYFTDGSRPETEKFEILEQTDGISNSYCTITNVEMYGDTSKGALAS